MKYQISPDIKNKYNLAINSIAMVAIILVLNYFISLAINNSHTNVTNAISEKMSLAQKAKIDNDMVVNYIKKYGDNNDNALSYQGKLALIKQIEEKATSSGISDITWSMGAVIKSEINDYRLSGYKIYETPVRLNIISASKTDINSFISDLAKINSSAVVIKQVIMDIKPENNTDIFSAEIELRIKNYIKD